MAGSLAGHRTAAGVDSWERRTAEGEGSLGAGNRPGEGTDDATFGAAAEVVDCSLGMGTANAAGVVGADCSQAEDCSSVGMVADERQAVVGRSTTWLAACREDGREGAIGTLVTRRIAGRAV